MIRFIALAFLLLFTAGCSRVAGYRLRAVPGVTVIPAEAAARFGEAPASITILRKKFVHPRLLVEALMSRARKSGWRYLSNLQVQWILSAEGLTAYCQVDLQPARVAPRGNLEKSAQRTAQTDRQARVRAAALLRLQNDNPEYRGGAMDASLTGDDRGRRPDLGFVGQTEWVLYRVDPRCKFGGTSANDQITLTAIAY